MYKIIVYIMYVYTNTIMYFNSAVLQNQMITCFIWTKYYCPSYCIK